MANYSCVLQCKSKGEDPSISFHLFPLNSKLRSIWLKKIDISNWSPIEFSNSSRICSKHFLPTDFITDGKFKRLKKTAVPSVFQNDSALFHGNKVPASEFKSTRPIIIKNIASGDVFNNHDLAHDISSLDKSSNLNLENIDFQHMKEKYINILKSLEELKEKAKVLENLKGNKYYMSFLKIMEGSKNNDRCAIFLLDQIKNYKNKKPLWSENSLKNCLLWESMSPEGYEYVSSAGLLTVPCSKTIKYYVKQSWKENISDQNELPDQNEELNNHATTE